MMSQTQTETSNSVRQRNDDNDTNDDDDDVDKAISMMMITEQHNAIVSELDHNDEHDEMGSSSRRSTGSRNRTKGSLSLFTLQKRNSMISQVKMNKNHLIHKRASSAATILMSNDESTGHNYSSPLNSTILPFEEDLKEKSDNNDINCDPDNNNDDNKSDNHNIINQNVDCRIIDDNIIDAFNSDITKDEGIINNDDDIEDEVEDDDNWEDDDLYIYIEPKKNGKFQDRMKHIIYQHLIDNNANVNNNANNHIIIKSEDFITVMDVIDDDYKESLRYFQQLQRKQQLLSQNGNIMNDSITTNPRDSTANNNNNNNNNDVESHLRASTHILQQFLYVVELMNPNGIHNSDSDVHDHHDHTTTEDHNTTEDNIKIQCILIFLSDMECYLLSQLTKLYAITTTTNNNTPTSPDSCTSNGNGNNSNDYSDDSLTVSVTATNSIKKLKNVISSDHAAEIGVWYYDFVTHIKQSCPYGINKLSNQWMVDMFMLSEYYIESYVRQHIKALCKSWMQHFITINNNNNDHNEKAAADTATPIAAAGTTTNTAAAITTNDDETKVDDHDATNESSKINDNSGRGRRQTIMVSNWPEDITAFMNNELNIIRGHFPKKFMTDIVDVCCDELFNLLTSIRTLLINSGSGGGGNTSKTTAYTNHHHHPITNSIHVLFHTHCSLINDSSRMSRLLGTIHDQYFDVHSSSLSKEITTAATSAIGSSTKTKCTFGPESNTSYDTNNNTHLNDIKWNRLQKKTKKIERDFVELSFDTIHYLCQSLLLLDYDHTDAHSDDNLRKVGNLKWESSSSSSNTTTDTSPSTDTSSSVIKQLINSFQHNFIKIEAWLPNKHYFHRVLLECVHLTIQTYVESFYMNTMASGIQNSESVAKQLQQDYYDLVTFFNDPMLQEHYNESVIISERDINTILLILLSMSRLLNPLLTPFDLVDDTRTLLQNIEPMIISGERNISALLHITGLRNPQQSAGESAMDWLRIIKEAAKDLADEDQRLQQQKQKQEPESKTLNNKKVIAKKTTQKMTIQQKSNTTTPNDVDNTTTKKFQIKLPDLRNSPYIITNMNSNDLLRQMSGGRIQRENIGVQEQQNIQQQQKQPANNNTSYIQFPTLTGYFYKKTDTIIDDSGGVKPTNKHDRHSGSNNNNHKKKTNDRNGTTSNNNNKEKKDLIGDDEDSSDDFVFRRDTVSVRFQHKTDKDKQDHNNNNINNRMANPFTKKWIG